MLYEAARQGVDVQLLTPHFYPWEEDIGSFLLRRDMAFEAFCRFRREWWPQVLLGAEVAFFRGIAEAEVDGLCIGGSRLLLIELPFQSWDRDVSEELAYLALNRGYRVILAHIERYMGYKNNRAMLSELSALPIVMQLNAESFLRFPEWVKTVKLAEGLRAFVLGSDAHGTEHRVPDLAEGREAVEKHMGGLTLNRIDRAGAALIREIVDG